MTTATTLTLRTTVRSALLACALFVAPTLGSAEPTSQIQIKDTAGVTRNVSEVETAGDVEFALEDKSGMPAQGAEVTLTNESTGEVMHAISANGVVKFAGITPGIWVVASTTPSITFTSISVFSATAVAGSFGGTAILGMSIPTAVGAGVGVAAAVAGGTIAIANANDDNDSSDPVLSPIL